MHQRRAAEALALQRQQVQRMNSSQSVETETKVSEPRGLQPHEVAMEMDRMDRILAENAPPPPPPPKVVQPLKSLKVNDTKASAAEPENSSLLISPKKTARHKIRVRNPAQTRALRIPPFNPKTKMEREAWRRKAPQGSRQSKSSLTRPHLVLLQRKRKVCTMRTFQMISRREEQSQPKCFVLHLAYQKNPPLLQLLHPSLGRRGM